MRIREIVKKYTNIGYNFRNAQNLAAEEILLNAIASSPLSECVTLKGGIVMYNLTKSDRRVTQDVDFDLIRFSIDDQSLRMFVTKLNEVCNGVSISLDGEIEKLHQEDYQGARVKLLFKDSEEDSLRIKLDIGVHTYSAIEQKRLLFTFASGNGSVSIKANPTEQIAAEKFISLARLGAISTRYKDIYDIYYLIINNLIHVELLRDILELFFHSSSRQPNDINEFENAIKDLLDNPDFAKEAEKPASKWIDADYESVKKTIIAFVERL